MHPADTSPTRDSLALRLQGLQGLQEGPHGQPASASRPAWRLHVANALWQRLDSADPALQRALSARLHECLQQLENPAPEGASPATTPKSTPAPSTRQTLADVARARPSPSAALPGTGAELQAVAPFRQAWAQVNARQRVRQGQRQEPANAGPLNPHKLAQRTLALADELSPHYLTRLVHMLDALMWLEQAAVKPPPRAGGAAPKTKAKRR